MSAAATDKPRPPWVTYGLVWAALTVLLFLSLGVAFLPLGRWTTVLGLAIAGVKAGLVAGIYMELARAHPLLRLAAFAGCVFAGVLFAFTFTDVLSRP